VVSTPLKNISQNGNLPQIGVKKLKPLTSHVMEGTIHIESPDFLFGQFIGLKFPSPTSVSARIHFPLSTVDRLIAEKENCKRSCINHYP